MNRFFENVWTKRVVALISPLYLTLVGILSYLSVFYYLEVNNPKTVCLLASAISLFALVIMLYTREQLLTKLVCVFILPTLLPAVLFYFGEWELLIPLLVTALIVFLFSGMTETAKVVYGTASLLLYLLGSLAYFVATSLFAPSTVSTTVETGVSPSGEYRYEVIQTEDRSDGSTKVNVESNTMDLEYDLVTFQIKGLYRTVYLVRPLEENVVITWDTIARSEITETLNTISTSIEITLSDTQMELIGKPSYAVEYDGGKLSYLMASEYENTLVSLTASVKALLETEEDTLPLASLSDEALELLEISITDLHTMYLTDLTDDDLAALGIPEEGDVMYYNGKAVFRYYIAILEEYFDISNREFTIS